MRRARPGRWIVSLLPIITICIAAVALQRISLHWDWSRLATALHAEDRRDVATAMGLTLVSFMALGLYDSLGCRVAVPGKVPISTALFAGAIGNAISNTLGFHAVTGTAVRLRIYRRCGIGVGDVLRVVSLSWLGIALGFASLMAMAGVFGWLVTSEAPGPRLATALGFAAALALFLRWLPSKGGRTVQWGAMRAELPTRSVALAFIAAGLLENGAAIAALYILLPAAAPSFMAFAFSYVCAIAVGVVSQVPGGLGIFEATLITVWGARIGPGLVPALAVYRIVYNFVPFLVSAVWLAGWEMVQARAGRQAFSWKAGSGE